MASLSDHTENPRMVYVVPWKFRDRLFFLYESYSSCSTFSEESSLVGHNVESDNSHNFERGSYF